MRPCKNCGQEFKPKQQRSLYCSENCRKREYDREKYRGTCGVCGVTTARRYIDRCAAHSSKMERALRLRLEIQRLWLDGVSTPLIAEQLGKTENHIGVEIHRMRADGWDMPNRYVLRDRVAA